MTDLDAKAAAPTATAADAPAADARFTALYDAHFAFAWRNLRRLGVLPAALDDAAQDVFLVVHRRLADVPADAVRPWLFAIVRRVAADHRRSARRRGADQLTADAIAAPADTSAERAEAARIIHTLLAALDDDKREVFVLAELEQMPAPEIAQALAIPVNTVYSRLRAARAAFEKQASRLRGRAP